MLKRSLIYCISLVTVGFALDPSVRASCLTSLWPDNTARGQIRTDSANGHAARTAFLALDQASGMTVTSNRQERRRVVDVATYTQFLDSLREYLGATRLLRRDSTLVETDTDYRHKLQGLDSHGQPSLKWDIRWRIYRELSPEGAQDTLGKPVWSIMSDSEGDYGKLEIKRPGLQPDIFAQRPDHINKTSVVLHMADYLELMTATRSSFAQIRDGIITRTCGILKGGQPVNSQLRPPHSSTRSDG